MNDIKKKDRMATAVLLHFAMNYVTMAKAFNVTRSGAYQWLNGDGFPFKRAVELERLSNGRLKAIDTEGATFDRGDDE